MTFLRTDSTAFVGYNDMVAFGILDALYELKYKVPNDFSVCGFDNIPMANMNRISLTTVEHSIEAKGREAVDIIVRIRDSKTKNHVLLIKLKNINKFNEYC